MWGRAKGLDLKLFYKQVGNEGADGRTHDSTLYLFIIPTLEEKVCVFKVGLQHYDDVLDGHAGPLV